VRCVLALSRRHAQLLRERPLPREVEARFARLAEESAAEQRRIEAADTVPFEAFRQRYLAPEQLRV
jgi:glutamate--cysteine ligase